MPVPVAPKPGQWDRLAAFETEAKEFEAAKLRKRGGVLHKPTVPDIRAMETWRPSTVDERGQRKILGSQKKKRTS